MRAQFTFFHQGYDLLHEFDPFMRQVPPYINLTPTPLTHKPYAHPPYTQTLRPPPLHINLTPTPPYTYPPYLGEHSSRPVPEGSSGIYQRDGLQTQSSSITPHGGWITRHPPTTHGQPNTVSSNFLHVPKMFAALRYVFTVRKLISFGHNSSLK